MEDEKYNGWANWDTWNTMLILENHEPSYRWLLSWHDNFKKKVAKGKFSQEAAKEAVRKYIIPAARGGYISKRFGADFTPDPRINPRKVNKDEIIKAILEME